MQRVACLHTAESNIRVFDDALDKSGLTDIVLRHVVRADLLAPAEQAGGLTAMISRQTGQALRELCNEADAVLLTCSTLGPAAESVAPNSAAPILRIDAALVADAASPDDTIATGSSHPAGSAAATPTPRMPNPRQRLPEKTCRAGFAGIGRLPITRVPIRLVQP